MKKLFGLSKIRSKKLAVISLTKIIRIIFISFLLILAIVVAFIMIFEKASLKFVPKVTQIYEEAGAAVVSANTSSMLSYKKDINSQADSDFCRADIQLQLQNPELPNGCEATSLAMLLSAAGVKTTKQQAAQAMPTESFSENEKGQLTAPNPEKFYAGNPESKDRGFYAFVPPVQQAANKLLQKAGFTALQAQDISGYSFENISLLMEAGAPIMLWITIDYGELKYCTNFSWLQTDTNESYIPIANLHCVVAKIHDDESFTVFDPIKGEINVKYDKLKYVYEQMGKRALYIN